MKAQILDFINHLLIYDYILFGGIILVFILILILAIVIRHHLGWAVFLVLSGFGVLTVGPIVGYMTLHQYLFKNSVTLERTKALEFTEALLIKGTLENTSKRSFTECALEAGVHKVTHNRYLDRAYTFFPFQKGHTAIDRPLKPGEKADFKFLIEPFRYTKDFNVTVKADCR